MERHTVSRLIGAPPGYVGFDQGGLLTDGVDQHPHCVLLLDEIEKAHPDLFNILLQVMDHGKLTDHNGKQVDFRNVIIIMTTNAGAADLARRGLRLHAEQARRRRHGGDQPAVRAGVPQPSRRRRSPSATCRRRWSHKVVDKFVLQLEAQLADRNVTIELSDEARDWLVEHGYDEAMGARPMARLIQSTIKTPLADDVLFGKLKNGGAVRVIVEDRRERKEGARLRVSRRTGDAEAREGRHRTRPRSGPKRQAARVRQEAAEAEGSGGRAAAAAA